MLRREPLMVRPPLYSMKPSLRNLFMKKFTRDRVVPTISASVSCESRGSLRVTREHVGDEAIRELRVLVQHPHHVALR
jgi:hypothetical protein